MSFKTRDSTAMHWNDRLFAPRNLIEGINRNFRGCYPIKLGEQFRPCFIIGSGRSGNTLLRRIVMSGPDVYIPPETYILGDIIRIFRQYAYLDWDMLTRTVLSAFMLSDDFDTFPTNNFRPLYKHVSTLPRQERSLARILHEIYMYLGACAKPSAKRWGDKTPINVFYLDLIDSVFTDAKYLHIIRDGCDVVASYIEMGRYSTLDLAAQRWLQATSLCRDFGKHRASRYCEFKYEDLVADPATYVERACSFLDITHSNEMLYSSKAIEEMGDIGQRPHYSQASKPISERSVGKGRRSLSRSDLRRLELLIGDRLRELGYPPAV